MKVTLTIKADEIKLIQLLDRFKQKYAVKYDLDNINGEFKLRIETDEFGEFIRRLKHIKEIDFKVKRASGM